MRYFDFEIPEQLNPTPEYELLLEWIVLVEIINKLPNERALIASLEHLFREYHNKNKINGLSPHDYLENFQYNLDTNNTNISLDKLPVIEKWLNDKLDSWSKKKSYLTFAVKSGYSIDEKYLDIIDELTKPSHKAYILKKLVIDDKIKLPRNILKSNNKQVSIHLAGIIKIDNKESFQRLYQGNEVTPAVQDDLDKLLS